MDILFGLAGLAAGAFVAWEIAQGCAAAEMNRLYARSEEKIRHWQAEAKRARAAAAQAEDKLAAWLDGCQQGREDALSLARSLTGGPSGPGGPGGPGGPPVVPAGPSGPGGPGERAIGG